MLYVSVSILLGSYFEYAAILKKLCSYAYYFMYYLISVESPRQDNVIVVPASVSVIPSWMYVDYLSAHYLQWNILAAGTLGFLMIMDARVILF